MRRTACRAGGRSCRLADGRDLVVDRLEPALLEAADAAGWCTRRAIGRRLTAEPRWRGVARAGLDDDVAELLGVA